MEQAKRLDYMLDYLVHEHPAEDIQIPNGYAQKRALLRSLVNIRPPKPVSEEFLSVQDAFLQEETKAKGSVRLEDIPPCPSDDRLYLWQGDITRLAVDAIVNAANSQLLGCFIPCHGCINNAIHTAAGVQLRQNCFDIMQKQKHAEPTGSAKITSAYNLPSKYVIHTVGPIIHGDLTQEDCGLLAACYKSCLDIAAEHKLNSIAFCCISTGEFHFPNKEAAEIAVQTVKDYLRQNTASIDRIVFNVFKDIDFNIYKNLNKNRSNPIG